MTLYETFSGPTGPVERPSLLTLVALQLMWQQNKYSSATSLAL